jgi:DNA ligase-1
MAQVTRRQFTFMAAAGLCIPSVSHAAPPLLLAREADRIDDPSRYLVSEKLDGVRALWDGTTLRFRSGRPVVVPAWFIARLPRQALDGELWMARGSFDALSGIVRRAQPRDDEWRAVRYQVFELPDAPGSFEQRASRLKQIAAQSDFTQLGCIEQLLGTDRASLQRRLDQVVAAGGEGLMLHLADAPYLTGRSDALLKLKPMHAREAVGIGPVPGRGKHEGRLGALLVEMPDGQRFKLGGGFTDAQRNEPPPVGSWVTYRYNGTNPSGLPRFARFVRIREDR